MESGIVTSLGDYRAPLVLVALLLLPVLAFRAATPRRNLLVGYFVLAVVLVFAPLVSRMAGRVLGPAFYYRLGWTVPVPLLVSLAIGMVATRPWRRSVLAWCGCAAFLVAFARTGPRAVTREVASRANLGAWKVHHDRFEVARAVVAINGPRERALASEDVAMYMPAMDSAPPMVGVRNFYLRKLQRLDRLQGEPPDSALEARRLLFVYMGGEGKFMPFERAVVLLRAANPRTVTFREAHRDAARLVPALEADGYTLQRLRGFIIAVRPPAP